MATKDLKVVMSADATQFKKGVGETTDSLRALKREQDKIGREAKATFDKAATSSEKYASEVKRLKGLLDQGAISQQTYGRSVAIARKEMVQSRAASMGFSSSMMSMVNPATLAATALAAIAAGAVASYKAFKEDQKAAEDLAMSLKSLGVEGAGLKAVFADNSASLGYGTSEQRAAYTAMIRITGDAKQAEGDLRKAMDVSAKTGASLTDSAKAIADARRGNIQGLQQLNLLSAREAELLGKVSDSGERATLALKTIEKHTKGAAEETDGLNERVKKSTNNFNEMKVAVGEAASALLELAKNNAASEFFGRHWNNALNDVKKNMGNLTLGAKYLASGMSMDDYVASMVKAEVATKATATAIGEMSTALNQFTSDGMTADERAIQAVISQKEALEIEKKRQAVAEQRREIQSKIHAATSQHLELLRYDLQIANEIDERSKERLRYEKEIAAIKQSTTNATERNLKLEIASAENAKRMQAIDAKTRADFDKTITDLDKDRLARQKKLADDGRALTESLRSPLQKYRDEVERLNELLEAGAISQEVYAAGIRKNNDDRASQTKRLLIDADSVRKEQMAKAAADAKVLGDALYGAIEQSFIDPFEKGIEGIMKSLLGNLAKAGGQKLIEFGLSSIGSAAGFASGGYTGGGNPSDVAGVVHRNEMVMESPIVRGQEGDWARLRQMVQQGTPVRDIISGPTSVDGSVTIINNVDNDASGFVRSVAGQSAIMNVINKNAPAIRRLLR